MSVTNRRALRAPASPKVTKRHRDYDLRDAIRIAFIAEAEAAARRRLGRSLTATELELALRAYPGD